MHVGDKSQGLLTIILEDYFQLAPFSDLIGPERWKRFESRVEKNTLRTLSLLDEFDAKATFFVSGWIATQVPEIVIEVSRRGHEIASRGYYRIDARRRDHAAFREDLCRSRDSLEPLSANGIVGYRSPRWFTRDTDLWPLDVLAEEGFVYDSSVCQKLRPLSGVDRYGTPYRHRCGEQELWEFPLPTVPAGTWRLPVGGGNYFRQLPHWLMHRAVDHRMRVAAAPCVMYFHVWELDPDIPRIAASHWQRVRLYRNLQKMPLILRYYLDRYRFDSIGHHLGILDSGRESAADSVPSGTDELDTSPGGATIPTSGESVEHPRIGRGAYRQPITIVVPCFNERETLPYLARTLASVDATLSVDYDLRYVFVDDGSDDDTWQSLQRLFGSWQHAALCRHQQNRGVAASILTGIRASTTEVVCSIDCDCTYDPHQLKLLLPMLLSDVDVVTASPYHQRGQVRHVAVWRLFPSKLVSKLYRGLFRNKLATYTSCFRVYRRDAVADIELQENGFLGVTEMLAVLDLAGCRVVECPAVLEARLLGRSKMSILRSIVGHLRLLLRIAAVRLHLRKSMCQV